MPESLPGRPQAEEEPPAGAGGDERPPDAAPPRAADSPLPDLSADGTPRDGVARPLLASEALMDDLAPVKPGEAAARFLAAVVGLLLIAAAGLLPRGPGGASPWPAVVLGGIALVAAMAPASYRQRAIALLVVGLLLAALGLRGVGPASGMATGGEIWGFFRFLAATTLPAALLFRARYRAYAKARWILAASFVAAVPFLVRTAAMLAGAELDWWHLGAVAGAVAILASLAGFMGAETTAAGTYTALGVIVALTAQLALERLTAGGAWSDAASLPGAARAAIGFAVAAVLASFGLFQVFAWRFAGDARRIDVHRPVAQERPDTAPPDEDWSTRG
jgi:hypothetical protein